MTLGDLCELGKIRRTIDSSRLWNSKSDGNELLRINFGINSIIHIDSCSNRRSYYLLYPLILNWT